LPESVEYSFSNDGNNFDGNKVIINDVQQNEKTELIKKFTCEPGNIPARFIRVKAKNIGTCPTWHKGAGDKAWIFCDEISVE
jgi:hypothetical protein